jgi:predicted 2-oxoglutarate/Fe(II)-dependent dioxygenase YbiX
MKSTALQLCWFHTFLDADLCARIRAAMDRGATEPAEVLGVEFGHEPHVRRASTVNVEAETLKLVEKRLDDLRTQLSDRYATRLGAREGASFLRYGEGGFYRPHRDRGVVASWPAAAHRRIALVLFLNSARRVDESGVFDGGSLLVFSDEPDEPAVEIHPRAGLLVAFPATHLHEVTTVERGVRDTVVDWFYDDLRT